MQGNILRDQLIDILTGENAHDALETVVKDFPKKHINTIPPHVSYSFWALLEHIRRTQADLLEYMSSNAYQHKAWPKDYWPDEKKQVTETEWETTIAGYLSDRKKLAHLMSDPTVDIFAEVPNGNQEGNGYPLFRAVLLAIDHNAYHIGEFSILKSIVAL